jgi:hypothetical protein
MQNLSFVNTIEMAFRLLKVYLGMSHWWSNKQELILVQTWVVLLLSHLVYALCERIAIAAHCDPFEVSVPLLVDLLPQLGSPSKLFRAANSIGPSVGSAAGQPTSRAGATLGGSFVLLASPPDLP